MRTVLYLISISLAAASFSFLGCSASDDFSFSIDKKFVVTNYDSYTYSRIDTADAAKASSDFSKYKSDLSALTLQSATYTVTGFAGTPSQKITSATLSVGDLAGAQQKVVATLSNVSLSAVNGLEQPLALTDEGKDFFRNQLQGPNSAARLYFTATTNEKPVTFTVNFHFNFSATYSVSWP